MMPSDGPQAPPPEIRFLKILVTALTVTMIAGLVAIVALLVIRLPDGAALPELPASVKLPDGAKAEAVTFARSSLIVVTDHGEVLVYGRDGQLLRQIALD